MLSISVCVCVCVCVCEKLEEAASGSVCASQLYLDNYSLHPSVRMPNIPALMTAVLLSPD